MGMRRLPRHAFRSRDDAFGNHGTGADRPMCRPADDCRRCRGHRRCCCCQCCCSLLSSPSFLLLLLLLLLLLWRQKSGIPCWPVSTCPLWRESSRPPFWWRRRPALSCSHCSASCASASPSPPAGRVSAKTTIGRSRPCRSLTGTIGAGQTQWGTPLGGRGGAEANDMTTTMVVENRIRPRQRPSLVPLLVLVLLLL